MLDGRSESGPKGLPETKFHQQELAAWEPAYFSRSSVIVFIVCGIIFLLVGAIIIVLSSQLKSFSLSYSSCVPADRVKSCTSHPCRCHLNFTLTDDMPGPVYIYYRLTSFYQNHRSYSRSVSFVQLLGRPMSRSERSRCAPLIENEAGLTYLPCGLVANSIFNDTFTLFHQTEAPKTPFSPFKEDTDELEDTLNRSARFRRQAPSSGSYSGRTPTLFRGENIKIQRTRVSFDVHGLVQSSLSSRQFGPLTDDAVMNTTKPEYWPKPLLERNPHAFLKDEAFMVWMQPSLLRSFSKLAGVLNTSAQPFTNGLPKGFYTVVIEYNFPVVRGGDKLMILANTNFMGGQNLTLGYMFIIAGAIEIALGIGFTVLRKKQIDVYRHLTEWTLYRPEYLLSQDY